jgi:Phosphate-selective porin O and P
LQATDDNAAATADVDNNAYYVQALYVIKNGGRTVWAPLFRYDVYEKSAGAEEIAELTLGVNYYLTENVRCMVEYWDRSGDGGTADDDRLTLQVYAAF